MKTTISLLILGGIEAIVNLIIPIIYLNIEPLGPARKLYTSQFLLHAIHVSVCLSHFLV